jgi:hypothetical protein
MNRGQVICLHLSVALTSLTGAVFALMKYGMESDDPFAVANHPLQPQALSLHVVVSPLLTFVLGWTFANHIWPKFRNGNGFNRRSGVWSMLLIVPMTLSGYLLQIATSESIRSAMTMAHWISSGIFVIAYAMHIAAGWRRKAIAAASSPLPGSS